MEGQSSRWTQAVVLVEGYESWVARLWGNEDQIFLLTSLGRITQLLCEAVSKGTLTPNVVPARALVALRIKEAHVKCMAHAVSPSWANERMQALKKSRDRGAPAEELE
jgi:hypothetical protein